MADKKLNEVQKVTDMAYVPVILADGSVGQIAKADLASVVAGLMNISGLNVISTSLYYGITLKISRNMRSTLRFICYSTNGKGGFIFDILSDNNMTSQIPICNTISLGSTGTSAIGTIGITYDNNYIYVNSSWETRVVGQAFNSTHEVVSTVSGVSTLFANNA